MTDHPPLSSVQPFKSMDPAEIPLSWTKRPVSIEAVRFDGIENVDDTGEPMFNGGFEIPPQWLIDGLAKGPEEPGAVFGFSDGDDLLIKTLEGTMTAQPGDWIIRGVQGELYPCKPAIFEATYEPTAGAPSSSARLIGGVAMAELFDFGLALHALKSGERVARSGWNGKGMFLYLVPGSRFAVNRPPLLGIYPEGTVIDYQPHIDIKGADGRVSTWVPSIGDTLASDWEIVTEAPLP